MAPSFISTKKIDEIRRQDSVSYLQCLTMRLPGDYSIYFSAIEAGQSPGSVFSEFGRALADLLSLQENHLAELQRSFRYRENRIEWLLQENERLLNEPVRQLLGLAQQQIHDLTQRVEKTEGDLAATRRALDAEQTARLRETKELQRAIVTQNSIVAKQRIQLDNLGCGTLQGETPGSESSEVQS